MTGENAEDIMHVVVEGNIIYIAVVTDYESVTSGKLS
jgi:hypothetical protein